MFLFRADDPESCGAAEAVHDSQPDAFGRDNLTENGFHAFLVQEAKCLKEAVRNFFRMLSRTDIVELPKLVVSLAKSVSVSEVTSRTSPLVFTSGRSYLLYMPQSLPSN